MSRIVFDINVIVSALLFSDFVPGRAFKKGLIHGTILISGLLARELNQVLSRRKFDRYISQKERDEFLAAQIRSTDQIEITEYVRVCRDPCDNLVLEVAINGEASYIVSGDHDLLVLNPFRGVEILTPAEFLRLEFWH